MNNDQKVSEIKKTAQDTKRNKTKHSELKQFERIKK